MKCNQWKQFKQQCENSCFRLQQMINKKDIEFMDVGVIKEEESDDENNFDTTNYGFGDVHHSSDSDEKEKLAEIITELNPVCEIKEEFLSFELKNLNLKLKKYPKRVHNPNLILPPMKMIVKKTTDISDLDQDEFNIIPKTENSSVAPPQPTRNLQKRKSTKRSYTDNNDDDDNNNSGNDNESDSDISYRKRPTLIYKCKTCRKRFSGCNLYEIHYVTAHMTNKEVS